MSQAIPTSDPALLAAQSRAGQAGVDAYEAARRELEQRQGTATAQAMYAAQQRGAPTASMRSAFTQANDAYNQRIASLTQASASYQDSMAAREARMADYSRAIGEARGLIADEAAQAVAPIEARSEFELQRLRQQGQNAVDEIEAQIRLEAARMAAAAASRGRGGGGGGGGGRRSLGGMSESELRASLLGGGGARIEQLQETVSDANRRAASNQAMAARWTGAGMAAQAREDAEREDEWIYDPVTGMPQRASAASNRAREAAGLSRAVPRREPTPTGPQPSPYYNLQTGPGGTGMGSRPFTGPEPVMVAPPPPPPAPSPITLALQQAFPQMYDSSQSFLGQQYMDGQTYLQRAAQDMDPFQQNILATAYQQRAGSPWRDDEQIADTLYGSGDVMSEAMRQTGMDLFLQGYDITDPEMMRVMQGSGEYVPGMSLADVYGVQRGLGTVAEQQAAQQAAAEEQFRLTTEAQEQEIADVAEAQEVEDVGFVFETTGVESDRVNAPLSAQVAVLESEDWPTWVGLALENAAAAEDEDDFTMLMGESGLTSNAALALLRQMYRDGVLFLNAGASLDRGEAGPALPGIGG